MVVLVKGYGNHTNRLIQNAHLEAFCEQQGIPFLNTTLQCMAHHYPLKYDYKKSLYFKALFKSGLTKKSIPYIEFNDINEIEKYEQILLNHHRDLLFVGGWYFRNYEAVKSHREILLQRYESHKASPAYEKLCQQIKQYDVVLGVHIRRKDYKQWNNGKYYYSFETYEQLTGNFIQLFPNKSIFVVIFSDEKIIPGQLQIPTEHYISHFPYYIDHKLMGKCHYLIGPPSTFTLWPSFLYHVPYIHIYNPYQAFTLSDFRYSHC